jgi:hypothetical protein
MHVNRLSKLENASFAPVVDKLKGGLDTVSPERKAEVLETMSDIEFIEHRMELYFQELQRAVVGGASLVQAEELALNAALEGLIEEEES